MHPSGDIMRQHLPQKGGKAMNDVDVSVIGVGGGGCNSLNAIVEMGMVTHSNAVFIDAESRGGSYEGGHVIFAEKKYLKTKRGFFHNQDWGRSTEADALTDLASGFSTVCVVVGLGGQTGGYLGTEVVELLKENGAEVIVFAIMPFRSEGMIRAENAAAALERFESAADQTYVMNNEDIVTRFGEGIDLQRSFQMVDHALGKMIASVETGLLDQLSDESDWWSKYPAVSGQPVVRSDDAMNVVGSIGLLE